MRCIGEFAVLRTPIRALLLVLVALSAGRAEDAPVDLTGLSLEELMDIEVTLVSRKPEKLAGAAAAVCVLTREDLRRSGVQSLPEALRLMPGMQVAHVDANKWTVTARGFSNLFANKLLVLIDGRSIYTPIFSGVFWESQDVVLEDVERIEVIRGPGGALWGANAVNGVINIVTRKAQDTQGGFLQIGGGTEERGFTTLRYGGRLGDRAYFRTYAKAFNRDASADSLGRRSADGWRFFRTGGRVDWEVSSRSSLTLQGDFYRGSAGQTYQLVMSSTYPFVRATDFDARIDGGDLLGRWEHTFDGGSDLALQFFYDGYRRKDLPISGIVHTADMDLQHRFHLNRRHEIVWGAGYRSIASELEKTFTFAIDPPSRRTHLFSAFFHDEIALVKDRLRLMLGSKLEHNSFTGLEVQPNLRLLWAPASQYSVWGAVSRAVRTPSRTEEGQRFIAQALASEPSGPDSTPRLLGLVVAFGNQDVLSETLLAFDLGCRTRVGNRLSLDLAAFYNIYDRVRTDEFGAPVVEESPPPPHLLIPLRADNRAYATTYGAELSANWQMLDRWRIRTAYTYLHMALSLEDDSKSAPIEGDAGENPRHRAVVRASADLPGRLELDVIGRYVHDLPAFHIDRYLALDVRAGWSPVRRLELSLTGRNLLAHRHREFVSFSDISRAGRVETGVYSALAWRF